MDTPTYCNHYICIDVSGCIIDGWSDGPHNTRPVTLEDILLNDQGGYQFRLIVNGEPTEENPPLFTFDFIPLYKLDGEQVLVRTEQEVQTDRDAAERRKMTADRNYEPGEYLTMDGSMYRVLLPISKGSYITPGTNAVQTTLENEISNLNKEES